MIKILSLKKNQILKYFIFIFSGFKLTFIMANFVSLLRKYLNGDPNSDYLLGGINCGFNIG